MDTLEAFVPFFVAGIFLVGFLALLLAGFNAMLKPLEKNQVRLETELKEMKKETNEKFDKLYAILLSDKDRAK